MLTTIRTCARPALGARVAACLLAGLLALPAQAAPSTATGTSSTGRDVVGTWIARIDQRATELEAMPRVQQTRVGYGSVLKKGDGGMVDVVAPGPMRPSDVPEGTAPAAGAVPTIVVTPPTEPIPQADPSATPGNALSGTATPGTVVEVLPPPPALTIQVRARTADRVGRLSTRLIELGFLNQEQWTETFDDTLEVAVRAFQLSEGLMQDGKVGEVTRQALDRTPKEAAKLMRGATASMRAFQASVPDTVILVNLPSQTVSYIERGKLNFTMRAVVGRPSRQTPLLQDRVTSVTINPTWTVPPTVLVEDKLPVLRKKGNTGIKDAVVYLDGVEVVPESINWWQVTPERIRIVQKPGDDNALGRFRFNLTNGDGIFLHGTNDPRLFERDLRAASSGCVRLADARMVAETLLRPAKLDSAAIERQLDSGKTKTVSLPNAVPVRFVYWTSTVETDGTVRVHPGIYDDVPTSSSAPSASQAPAAAGTVSAPRRVEPKPVRPTPAAAPQPAPAPAQSSSTTTPARAADTRNGAEAVRTAM
ncbi:L,D-transpeptidase family protein [Azospirillum brasilense]|uniref:Murein L,D-transpeptidase n=1 Tax=Azospirillum brasilense TaxID=192 RepID=A0A6L3AVR6_AZOBR|nr:L,D-transpeptidase family protein [Azospirillum brasilense]KAA0680532.1 murein L,D-transpeptidase [Azospirillum brasilense]